VRHEKYVKSRCDPYQRHPRIELEDESEGEVISFGTSKEGTREETTSEQQQKSRQNDASGRCRGVSCGQILGPNMTW